MPEYPRNSLPDYYKVLGIKLPPNQVTKKIVDSQFRRLAKEAHPDTLAGRLGRAPIASEEEERKKAFQLLNEARSTLIDPDKKRRYDLSRNKNVENEVNNDRDIELFIQKLTDVFVINGTLRNFIELNEIPLQLLKEFQTVLDGYQGKMKYSHADVIVEFGNCIKAKEKYRKDFWKVFKAAISGNHRGVNAKDCIFAGYDWDDYQKEFPVSRRFKFKFDKVLESFEDEARQIVEGFNKVLVSQLSKRYRY